MTLIHTATGIKFGKSGKVARTLETVGEILSMVPKGEARKARKHLHGLGKRVLAAAKAA